MEDADALFARRLHEELNAPPLRGSRRGAPLAAKVRLARIPAGHGRISHATRVPLSFAYDSQERGSIACLRLLTATPTTHRSWHALADPMLRAEAGLSPMSHCPRRRPHPSLYLLSRRSPPSSQGRPCPPPHAGAPALPARPYTAAAAQACAATIAPPRPRQAQRAPRH